MGYPVAAFTLVSLIVTFVLIQIDPKYDVYYDGFRRPKYTGSLLWQLVVLPACILLMINGHPPASVQEILLWSQQGRNDFKAVRCYYFAALNAAQLKDFITGPLDLWR